MQVSLLQGTRQLRPYTPPSYLTETDRTGKTSSHYRDSTLEQLGKLGAQQGNTQLSSESLSFRKALEWPAIVIAHPMGTVHALCADRKLTGPSAPLALVPRVCAGPWQSMLSLHWGFPRPVVL